MKYYDLRVVSAHEILISEKKINLNLDHHVL